MILASPVIRVIPQSRESFLAGLHLYRSRPDKGYSLVDCISMQLTPGVVTPSRKGGDSDEQSAVTISSKHPT